MKTRDPNSILVTYIYNETIFSFRKKIKVKVLVHFRLTDT